MKKFIFLGLPTLLLAMGSLLLLANIYTYHRLSDESEIAQIVLLPQGEKQYIARVSVDRFCTMQDFSMHGDQWQIDAQFVKWKPWANLLGLDSMYRLERLSGRYKDIEEENTQKHVAHALRDRSAVEVTELSSFLHDKLAFLDSHYGSSAYEDVSEKHIYTVHRSQTGLFIRKQEVESVHEIIALAAEPDCEPEPSRWQSIAQKTEDLLFF